MLKCSTVSITPYEKKDRKVVITRQRFCHCCVESKRGRIRRVKHWKTALAVLAALSTSLALADDFKTTDGKEYKNAKVSRVEPDGIVITFSGETIKIPFTKLSEELRRKYNYNPEAAKSFAEQTEQINATKRGRCTRTRRCPQKGKPGSRGLEI